MGCFPFFKWEDWYRERIKQKMAQFGHPVIFDELLKPTKLFQMILSDKKRFMTKHFYF